MSNKEKKMKRLLITAAVGGITCISLILVHYHQQGQEAAGRGRIHFMSGETVMESEGLEEGILSSPTENLNQKRQVNEPKLTYIGLETVSSLLGDDRYQEFKVRFEEFLQTNNTGKCSQVTLASSDVISDQTQITCYLQTDDEDKSIYQFIYRYTDDSYTFMKVDKIPENQQEAVKQASTSETQDADASQSQSEDPTADAHDSGNQSQTSTGGSTGSRQSANTAAESASSETTNNAYHTVNGVQFENMDIYETLSEKAVDLFTKDVTAHWSSIGEDRRLISTTVPEKNGSKVTFTCTFPDDGDSFQVTLDLNQEIFSYS